MRRSRYVRCSVLFLAVLACAAQADDFTLIKKFRDNGGIVRLTKVNQKPAIEHVGLSGPKPTDEIVKLLPGLRYLSSVKLEAPKLTSASVKEVVKVKELRTVEFVGKIADDDAAKLLAGVKKVQAVTFAQSPITDEGIKALATLPKLEFLNCKEAGELRGTTVPELAACKKLRSLVFYRANLGELPGWGKLAEAAELETLALDFCNVTDRALLEIGKLKQVRHLHLNDNPISNAELAELKKLTKLDSLHLSNTKITPKAVPILCELKSLRFLSVKLPQVGADAEKTLKQALPNCEVMVYP